MTNNKSDDNSFNFIHKGHLCDKHLFFGPIESGDKFITIDDEWKLEDIAVACEIFQSKTQARKNGWNGELKDGWSEFRSITKKKISIFVLNKFVSSN